ncbi:glyoxalase [Glycomyces sp. TRM65418]|uniref:VOC family protein n=1 Tax=Glycomyces sp. TRM65418 TaxID=2867006 RepID=UPI001CE5A452|nr:VOC family protein [Glycomyces sp. TRM65418]MCC3761921.1 glyoxalase [Glycomyces sp. TRM65418]QZD56001.1 glyoxalase [Glycomyces sp. TRM65418]
MNYGYGLHHVQLAIRPHGEADARAFYVDVLGMTEIAKPPELAERGGLWLRTDALELHLGVENDLVPSKRAHPGLLVADLDGLAAALKSAGHPVDWDDRFPGFRRCYARDPFGNRLEFLTPLAG